MTDDLRQNVRWSGSNRHRGKKLRRKCKREGAYCIYHFEMGEDGRWEREGSLSMEKQRRRRRWDAEVGEGGRGGGEVR